MSGKTDNENVIVIFGATGDLCYRKLMPALYMLVQGGKLNSCDKIIAIGRKDLTSQSYVQNIRNWVEKSIRVKFDEQIFTILCEIIIYLKMDLTNLSHYEKLNAKLSDDNAKEALFYYAVAPSFFDVISEGIMSMPCKCKRKIVIEKPFGETLAQAKMLSEKLIDTFGRENIYHIDHYLGKEMVQSIQAIRFKNSIFKACWNKNFIDHVKIYACEELGVETRGAYYDATGAMKDMVQNHLMQILSLVAMDEPSDFNDIKQRQVEVMRRLRPIEKLDIKKTLLLGQYEGYKNVDGVDESSLTDTLACLKLFVDTDRFKDVPFYILTGKKMAKREMNIVVVFKAASEDVKPDTLTFKVQPTEGVYLEFNIKEPGESNEIIHANMDFCQSCNIVYRMNTPEAYERLIYAALINDSTWFSTWEQIELCWNYTEQLKSEYHRQANKLYIYNQGLCFENDAENKECKCKGLLHEFMGV